MSDHGLLRKDQLEVSLHKEKKLIEEGVLKEDNPLDVSDNFRRLCEASRRGDMAVCQEMIQEGVNINAKDQYDYTPLILASLCGHYETVELLLESGALCERDTFQGERCLYNALNDKIRNLLLAYDYSKSTDPLQPLAAHLTSLLYRTQPRTSDIMVSSTNDASPFCLHKFILAARSPYLKSKLDAAPETTLWRIPATVPTPSLAIALRHLYLGELPRELGGPGTGFTDAEVLAGLDRISKYLDIKNLSELVLENDDRRLARQKRQDEVESARDQLQSWFTQNVLKHSVDIETSKASQVRWDKNNGIFSDILIKADEDEDDLRPDEEVQTIANLDRRSAKTNALGIPLDTSRSPSRNRKPRRSKLYPCHKAMLIRSEYFLTMFDSPFQEASDSPHLQIVTLDCSPTVLEIVLTFLYTEKADFGLDVAVDVLFAADMLFLEKLKAKAAVVISSLGNGTATGMGSQIPEDQREDSDLDIYEILRASWTTRVQRLEEFAARYMAYRLEAYIDDPEFAQIIKESASRISKRQETDSIELLDDIRYYLSERFRLRFEDTGFNEVEDELQQGEGAQEAANKLPVWGSDVAAHSDEGVDMSSPPRDKVESNGEMLAEGVIRTLDGEIAGDEFEQDAMNYQILLGKIETLLERLKLDA